MVKRIVKSSLRECSTCEVRGMDRECWMCGGPTISVACWHYRCDWVGQGGSKKHGCLPHLVGEVHFEDTCQHSPEEMSAFAGWVAADDYAA